MEEDGETESKEGRKVASTNEGNQQRNKVNKMEGRKM
jgi:hypothetical protein